MTYTDPPPVLRSFAAYRKFQREKHRRRHPDGDRTTSRRPHRYREPLVCVTNDRISGIDTIELASEPRRYSASGVPRSVDRETELFRAAETCQLRERINYSCGSRSGSTNNHKRRKPVAMVFVNEQREMRQINLEERMRPNNAKRLAAETRHVRNFVQRVVALGGQVDPRSNWQAVGRHAHYSP
jgi:hypothetical protein